MGFKRDVLRDLVIACCTASGLESETFGEVHVGCIGDEAREPGWDTRQA